MKTLKPDVSAPGSLLAIPLESGGFGVALVARKYKYPGAPDVVYVYGFDRIYETIPLEVDVASLTIIDAIHQITVNDQFAREGRWQRIAQWPGFVESQWPVAPEAVADKGIYPSDVSEQRICISHDTEWCDVNVPNDGLANAYEFTQLPNRKGLGNPKYLEISLDRAIRKREPWHYFRVTDEAACIWNNVIERAKQKGVYPPKAPVRSKKRRARRPSK